MWLADVTWQWLSCCCDWAEVTGWSHMTVIFMLLWHECQRQMWPAEVIWQWSSCYCDMNVSGRCDLLKSYNSDRHVTVTWMSAADVTCWISQMTVNFMLLWPADIILQDTSYYCDWHTNVNAILDPLLWYDFDLPVNVTGTQTPTVNPTFCCDRTKMPMLLSLAHTRQPQIWPAAVIGHRSPCCWD